MKKDPRALLVANNVWYFQGVEIKRGYRINIDGVSWQVVGFGQSTGKSQAPFLWIQHERRGITIFVPSLVSVSPTAITAWRENPRPMSPVETQRICEVVMTAA